MLYLVGLGLSDETDITVKGLEIVKRASRVYLEAYTSILLVDQSVLVMLVPVEIHDTCAASLSTDRSITDH
jgi:diphthamide biosynthesis methyltransferase